MAKTALVGVTGQDGACLVGCGEAVSSALTTNRLEIQ